jgi:hypothetical protein
MNGCDLVRPYFHIWNHLNCCDGIWCGVSGLSIDHGTGILCYLCCMRATIHARLKQVTETLSYHKMMLAPRLLHGCENWALIQVRETAEMEFLRPVGG